MKEATSFKDIESERRVKRVESDCGGPWQCRCFAGKRQGSPLNWAQCQNRRAEESGSRVDPTSYRKFGIWAGQPLVLSVAFCPDYDPRIARSSPASTEGRYARRGVRQVIRA